MALHEQYGTLCANRSVSTETDIQKVFENKIDSMSISSHLQAALILELFNDSEPDALTYLTHLQVTCTHLPVQILHTLATYLGKQTHLKRLTLNRVQIGDAGAAMLLKSISAHDASTITHLDLAAVGMSSTGAKAVSPLLTKSLGLLTHLDLSNNAANEPGVYAIENALRLRPASLSRLNVNLDGNLVTVELLNALTHGVGALGAVVGGVAMTVRAIRHGLSADVVASLAVFMASLFTMLTSSCVYHSCFRLPNASRHLRKADHCSIFILIAGSYTPFMVSYMLHPPTTAGPLTLGAVWLCAVVGVVRSLLERGSNRTRAMLALGMGWIGALSMRTMVERMQSGAVSGVVWGGIAYSVGIVFYLLGQRRPIMHVVWHVAVMLGGGFHYVALWKFVVNVR